MGTCAKCRRHAGMEMEIGLRQLEGGRGQAMVEVLGGDAQAAHHVTLIGILDVIVTDAVREQ